MTIQPTETILIVDFGSQVTQLIARRVREAGVYCEIAPYGVADEAFKRMKPKGVIFSGGPASVTAEESPRAPRAALARSQICAQHESAIEGRGYGAYLSQLCARGLAPRGEDRRGARSRRP